MDKIEILKALASLADAADEDGLRAEADAVTGAMTKLAQYEQGTNYWIANGRAFERAWKMKRKTKGLSDSVPITAEDFRSAQDCWFEVLEEFQDGLLGSQAEILSKYAKKKKKGKDKKEKEEAQDQLMSGPMADFHEEVSKGPGSAGKNIADHFGFDGAAAQALLSKISERLLAGSGPGPAFYEAIESLASDAAKAAKAAQMALDSLEKAARDSGAKSVLAKTEMIGQAKEAIKGM